MELYIQEFLRNADGVSSLSMEHGWSSGLSSQVESGFLPDSFTNVYSDGRSRMRVFIILYAHGGILSFCDAFDQASSNIYMPTCFLARVIAHIIQSFRARARSYKFCDAFDQTCSSDII